MQTGLRCFTRAFATKNLFNVNNLTVERTKKPGKRLPNKQLLFGKTFTDHMMVCDWTANGGWQAPKLMPLQNFSIHPAASSLHYALECFEGMKAYIDADGKTRLFRPMDNMDRLLSSAKRLAFPEFDKVQALECIKELVKLDKHWIPKEDGFSLYIRPTIISTHPYLGVSPSGACRFYTILSPVGPYYPEGFTAVKLYADPHNVRAWPGGTGGYKLGSNYAMGVYPQLECGKKGYSQVLWLFGDQITEVGTMNFMVLWKNKQGKTELVTAPLTDGTILPGVTRRSVLALCREWNEFDVVERKFTIHELIEAINEKRVIECFGCGTAAIVSPVKGFHYMGKDYAIPLDPAGKVAAGPLTQRLLKSILDIQYGRTPSDWSVVID